MADGVKPDPVCGYCGRPGSLARDHVVPRSRGGPDNATNIVMACKPCNSSKGDQLPSEWLGERCPAHVLLIEARVNAKLKTVFKRRDQKGPEPAKPPQLFAIHIQPNGRPDWVGEVVAEMGDRLRIEAADGVMLLCGVWSLSGSLYDELRSECRLFNDRDACVQQAHALLDQVLQETRSGSHFRF